MPELTIGQAAKRATEFVAAVHEDVKTLIATLDAQMAERGWFPTERNKISDDLGNALTADYWVLHHIARLYVRSVEAPTGAIAFGIQFAPEAFDGSICFVAVAQIPEGSTANALWRGWGHSKPLVDAVAQRGGPVELEGKIRDGIFPNALAGEGFVVLLDQVVDADALTDRLIGPALAAVARLG